MISVRRAGERGHVRMGWLDTWHSFSFGDYYDPRHMGWSVLRVINDDRVAGHSGFGMHGHRNMEILTVMLGGTLTHRDSMGNEATLSAGECQLMSAGRGVMHSEMNQSPEPVSLLQIWLEPEVSNTEPGYQQKQFEPRSGMTLIASPDGRDESFRIRQQASVWRGRLAAGERTVLRGEHGQHGWLHVIAGTLEVEGVICGPGDAIGLRGHVPAKIIASEEADLLYFDLP